MMQDESSSDSASTTNKLLLDFLRTMRSLEQPTHVLSGEQRYLTPLWVSKHAETPLTSFPGATGLSSVSIAQDLKEKIRTALTLLKLREQRILIQFWCPLNDGKCRLLTTKGQPFGIGIVDKELLTYRRESECSQFVVEEHEDGNLSSPSRVFQQELPEWTADISHYVARDYPQQNRAVQRNLRGSLALPVFEPATRCCVGVLELLTSSEYVDYAYEVEEVHRALQAANLTSPRVFDYPCSYVASKSRQHELDKIYNLLKVLCDTHSLPLAQSWGVSCFGSFVAHGQNLYKSCTSFNTRCIGKVCISTDGLPFYFRDVGMWNFHEACRKRHLEKSRGLVGKVLSSHSSCFCDDVTRVDEDEYPLVHDACMYGLTSCFAIYLRGVEGGSEYVLELFMPYKSKEGEDLLKLVETLKQHIELTSGFELGNILSTKVNETSLNILACVEEKGECLERSRKRKIDSPSARGNHGMPIAETLTSDSPTQSMLNRFTWDLSIPRGKIARVPDKKLAKHSAFGIYNIVSLLIRLKRWKCRSILHISEELCNENKGLVIPFSMSSEVSFGIRYTAFLLLRLIRWRRRSLNRHREDKRSVTIKVTFNDNMIKFRLPLSSGLLELENQVLQRFKIGSFNLKYMDEDNDLISIACDADLQNLLGASVTNSDSNRTIKLIVQLVDNNHLRFGI